MFKKLKHDFVYKILGTGLSNPPDFLKIGIIARDQQLHDEVAYALTNFPYEFSKINDCDILITDKFIEHFKRRMAGKKSILIDRYLFRASDAIRLRDLQWFLKSAKLKNQDISTYKLNFSNMLKKTRANLSTIIAPGPTYKSLLNLSNLTEIRSSTIIICNSVVKDHETLKALGRVDILCFSDPVFHFSSSKYCLQFISDVLKVVENFDPFIIVPISAAPLTQNLLRTCSPKVIGYFPSDNYVIPTPEKLSVKYSPNVLTSLLLPTAAAVSDKIYTIGCDGREKNEKYFWKHNKDAQYTDLMHTVFEKHPSFLKDQNLDYYYDLHLKRLSEDVTWLRSRRKSIVSLTPTFLDILK